MLLHFVHLATRHMRSGQTTLLMRDRGVYVMLMGLENGVLTCECVAAGLRARSVAKKLRHTNVMARGDCKMS